MFFPKQGLSAKEQLTGGFVVACVATTQLRDRAGKRQERTPGNSDVTTADPGSAPYSV